jgi:hypothetical protein
MKAGIVTAPEFGPVICVVEVNDDVGGVEQDNHVLREVGKRVDLQISIAQEHGAGIGDAERGADNGEVDIRKLLRFAHARRIAIACYFGDGRANNFGGCGFRPDWGQSIA